MHPFHRIELPGFQLVESDTWANEQGDILQALYFDLVPNLPTSLNDVAGLRAALATSTASQGGGLIEAEVVSLSGLPALRQIIKLQLPHQPSGQAFIGSYLVPRAQCSAVIKIQTRERGVTGVRESLVLAQVGLENYFKPNPFAPDLQGGLPYHVADDAARDLEFPDHPLSRVRQVLASIALQVKVDPAFAAFPPFPG